MIDVLKEYLVSLGFSVDTSSLNQARRAMRAAEDSVNQFSNSSLTGFAKAGVAVITFVATANLAIAKFVGGLAQAELENEMFARRMWMNVDAARAFTSSLDALGVSVQDLYLSPELMRKYLELNSLSKGMAVPDYDKSMQGVRDITFEFQKLKLEGKYALQWIVYYLTKILAGPLAGLKGGLAGINELIQKNLPKWSEKAAMVVSWFVKMGLAAWKIRYALGAVMAAFTAFKMMSMLTNPFGLMVLGLTALLLLIDDFTTWQDGGESEFPDLWKWLDGVGEKLKASGLDLKTFKDDLVNIKDSALELVDTLDKLLVKLGVKDGLAGLITGVLLNSLYLLNDVLKSVVMLLKEANGLLGGDISLGDIASGKADKQFESHPEENGTFPMDEAFFNFLKSIGSFWSKLTEGHSSGNDYGWSNEFKPMSYGYPKYRSAPATQITLAPVYHITEASSAAGTATQISRTNTALITRAVQGVNR